MANVAASSEARRAQEARAIMASNLAIYKRLQVGGPAGSRLVGWCWGMLCHPACRCVDNCPQQRRPCSRRAVLVGCAQLRAGLPLKMRQTAIKQAGTARPHLRKHCSARRAAPALPLCTCLCPQEVKPCRDVARASLDRDFAKHEVGMSGCLA